MEGNNLAQECISRPTKGIIRPGPGIPAWPGRNTIIRPSRGGEVAAWRGFLARPDPPDPAQPVLADGGPGALRKGRPGRMVGPAGARASQPSRGTGLAGRQAQPGWIAGRRPSRRGGPAGGLSPGPTGRAASEPRRGGRGTGPAEMNDLRRPGRGRKHRPSRDSSLVQPSRALCRPGPLYAGPGGSIPA
jgi:hypothetical protein